MRNTFIEDPDKFRYSNLIDLVHLDEYAVGLGKTGYYKLTYSFAAQVGNIFENCMGKNYFEMLIVLSRPRFASSASLCSLLALTID